MRLQRLLDDDHEDEGPDGGGTEEERAVEADLAGLDWLEGLSGALGDGTRAVDDAIDDALVEGVVGGVGDDDRALADPVDDARRSRAG